MAEFPLPRPDHFLAPPAYPVGYEVTEQDYLFAEAFGLGKHGDVPPPKRRDDDWQPSGHPLCNRMICEGKPWPCGACKLFSSEEELPCRQR